MLVSFNEIFPTVSPSNYRENNCPSQVAQSLQKSMFLASILPTYCLLTFALTLLSKSLDWLLGNI